MSTSYKNVVSHVRLVPGPDTTEVWTNWDSQNEESYLRFPNDVIERIVEGTRDPHINAEDSVGMWGNVPLNYNSAGLLVWNIFIPMQVFLAAVNAVKPTPKVGEIWEGCTGARYIVSEIKDHHITGDPVAVLFDLGTGSMLRSISLANKSVFETRVQEVQV